MGYVCNSKRGSKSITEIQIIKDVGSVFFGSVAAMSFAFWMCCFRIGFLVSLLLGL